MKTIIKLLPLLAVLAVSCSDDESGPWRPSNCTNISDWIQTGHELVYEYYSPFNAADSFYIKIKEQIETGVFRVEQSHEIGGITTLYWQPCGNDLYYYTLAALTDPTLVYKLDGNVGDKWTYKTTGSGGTVFTSQCEIMAKNVTVNTKAGSFNCIKIRQVFTGPVPGSGSIITEHFINKTDGIIKMESNTEEAYYLVRKNF